MSVLDTERAFMEAEAGSMVHPNRETQCLDWTDVAVAASARARMDGDFGQ